MARKRKLTIELAGEDRGARKAIAGLEKDTSKLGKVAGVAFGALKAAAVAGGAAVAAGTAVSIKSFADFDAALNESLAIMGDVSDMQRKEMSDAAREVAKTTKFSATQAAESYFFLASAGLDAEASIAALPKVAAFAQAGMFDMATATDLATDAQSALGLASDDAGKNLKNLTRVTDVLVKANTLANASVQQFSEALTNKAGAALKVANKDIEEGVAVLAAFADQGKKGMEAGEGLSILLRDLSRLAAENADEFDEFGIRVFDAEGNLRNMADIVADFEKVLGPMSDAEKAATLQTLGLTEAVADNVKLLLGSSDAIREYEKNLRDAGGTTEDVAEKQMRTLWAQLGLLRDRLMDMAIEVGSRIVPRLMPLVEWASDSLPGAFDAADRLVARWAPRVQAAVEPLVGWLGRVWPKVRDRIVEAFGAVGAEAAKLWPDVRDTVLAAAGKVAGFIDSKLLPALTRLADWFAGNRAAMIGLFTAIGAVAVGALGLLAAALLAPVAAAAVFAAKIVLVAAAVGAVAGLVAAHWDTIVDATRTAFEQVRTWVDRNWPEIQATITDVLTVIGAAVAVAVTVIQAAWDRFGKHIIDAAVTTWNAVWEAVSSALGILRGVIQTVAALIRGDWGQAWEGVKLVVSNAWDFITNLVRFAMNAVRIILQTGWSAVVAAANTLLGGLRELHNVVWDAITSKVAAAARFVLGLLVGVWSRIETSARSAWNGVRDVISGVVGWFRGVPGKIASAASGMWDGIWSAFKSTVNKVIGAWNSLSFTLPSISIPDIPGLPGRGSKVGGQTFRVPQIPRLAEGGIVEASPQGTLARLGEGGRDEAVIPLPHGFDSQDLRDGTTVVFDLRNSMILSEIDLERVVTRAVNHAQSKGVTVRRRR